MNTPVLKKIISQPLFHFLLIGAFFFLVYGLVNPAGTDKETIIIDDEIINRSIMLFEKEWGRKPDAEELKGSVDRVIRQEVLYRQALKMNLDHNDEIIKRRMEQKLSFITNDIATMKAPADTTLKSYFEKNKQKYSEPGTFSFSHIYFNPDNRTNARTDAQKLLQQLPPHNLSENELRIKGDAFPFLYTINKLNLKEIAKQMGDDFADSLSKFSIEKWHGPVLSGYGIHLVYITEITPSAIPDWSTIKDEVLRDYQYEMTQKVNEDIYRDFRKNYKVTLDVKEAALKKMDLHKKLDIDEN